MKNVPTLRFKGFSSEWKVTRLEEKFSFIRNGFVGIATPYYANSGIKYLQGKNIKNGSIDNTGLIYISDAFNSKYKKSQLKLNDIVMVQSGHVGECAVIDNEYVGSNCHALVILTPHSSNAVSSKFLVNYFYSSYGRKLIDKVKTGNTIEHILASEVKTLSPMLPDNVKEQTKIADFLTAIDDRISQLSQKCDGLAQYKKGVMQKIFSQELRFKDEKGRAFPAWEEKRLGDIGVFQGGGTPTTADDRYWNGVVPWISSSDLNENSIHEISITRFISDLAIKESATKLIQKNSLLIVSRVGVGKLAVTLDKVCTSQDFTNFTPQSDNVFYLAYYLFFHKGKLLSFSQGTSIKGFTKDDISSLKVELPCLKEQEKIAGFLSAVDEKISQAQAQRDALKQYKQGLLQQMFV